MSPVPAILAIYDHQVIGVTMTVRRTFELIDGKEAAREIADPKRGRYLLFMKTPATPFEQHTDDEAIVLGTIEHLFANNDCVQLGIQYAVLPELEAKIRAVRERFIRE